MNLSTIQDNLITCQSEIRILKRLIKYSMRIDTCSKIQSIKTKIKKDYIRNGNDIRSF